jgi:hypothetical protein
MAIRSVNIRPQGKGFVVSLTKPLAAETKLTPSHFKVKRYHYLYSGNYGSPQANEQMVALQNVEVSADRKSITLSLPVETHPIGMVYEINLGKLNDADGNNLVHNEAWYTVHQIPK